MQKKFVLVVSVSLASATAFSQDCKNYYFLQSNKTIEMTIYDKKGEANGRTVYSVGDVQNSGGGASATINSEMFNRKGKSVVKGNSVMECNRGTMMIDVRVMLPQQTQEQYSTAEAKVDKVYIEYPATMNAGDQLKDATLNMQVDNHGLKSTLSMVLNNRKVQGKESITTAAGTWDTYKITYDGKLTIKMLVPINMDVSGTEWYAPGFGVVKTQSKHGGTAITAIK